MLIQRQNLLKSPETPVS